MVPARSNIRFFDTCALLHKYVDGPHSARVRRLVGSSAHDCYISEWTVLEMVSALANRCRGLKHGVDVFDRWELMFFGDIATSRLAVRTFSQRDVLKARQLIRFAGVLRKRSLKSGDALVAASCLELALERRSTVTFYTSDWTLYSVIRDIEAFRSTLRMVFVGVTRDGSAPVSGRTRG